MHENREIPGVPQVKCWGQSGKVSDRTPDAHAPGKSHIGIVPVKGPNNAGGSVARGNGGTGIPPRNRKGEDGNPPPTPSDRVGLAGQPASLPRTPRGLDCFAAALARLRGGRVVTGDPEFKEVEAEIPILWLTSAQGTPGATGTTAT